MMPKNSNYDLEERTKQFAKRVRSFINSVAKSPSNVEDIKQLIRSSGSIGANYIEANESFSKKDFIMRVKICRKGAKESIYWLDLLEINKPQTDKERQLLIQESTELMKIFGSIVTKSS